jgi:hypothetical protein
MDTLLLGASLGSLFVLILPAQGFVYFFNPRIRATGTRSVPLRRRLTKEGDT